MRWATVDVPAWYAASRPALLGALSLAGQVGLAVWYTGEAIASGRPAYLALGTFGFVGCILITAGMVSGSWRLLRAGSLVGLVAWAVFFLELWFPAFFGFLTLPLQVRGAFTFIGGAEAFQSWFLYLVSGIELRNRQDPDP
jgi:hypothetical protein